jgi:cysteine-rich repeat protein
MDRRAWLWVGLLVLSACSNSSTTDQGVLVNLTNPSAVPGVVRLKVSVSNQHSSKTLSFPADAPSSSITFPTSFSFNISAIRNGRVDIVVEALNTSQLVVANGSAFVVLQSKMFTPAPIALSVGARLCGNGQLDQGESCDDGNHFSGDGCDYLCSSEGAVDASDGVDTSTVVDSHAVATAIDSQTDEIVAADSPQVDASSLVAEAGTLVADTAKVDMETRPDISISTGGTGGSSGTLDLAAVDVEIDTGGIANSGGSVASGGTVATGGTSGHGGSTGTGGASSAGGSSSSSPCPGTVPPGFNQPCGSCGGTTQCDGSCSNTPSNYGASCGSCGGTIKCDGTCSVATPATYGTSCGSCGGTVKCDGTCSIATPSTYGTSCGSCGGTVKCDGTCSIATPTNLGASCGDCGGIFKCDGTCSVATPSNYSVVCNIGTGLGACANAGKYDCSGKCTTSTTGLGDSTLWHWSPAPNGSWDWDCNGSVTKSASVGAPYDCTTLLDQNACSKAPFITYLINPADCGARAASGKEQSGCSWSSGSGTPFCYPNGLRSAPIGQDCR